MKPGLNKHINRLRRGIAGLLRNPIFDRFSEDRCGEIDNRSQKDNFVRGKPKVILNYLKRAGIDHSTNLERAFDAYNNGRRNSLKHDKGLPFLKYSVSRGYRAIQDTRLKAAVSDSLSLGLILVNPSSPTPIDYPIG